MTLYDIIYAFFNDNVFTNSALSAISNTTLGLNMNEWLCHTATISILVLGVIVLMLVVRWLFRVMAGLIRV